MEGLPTTINLSDRQSLTYNALRQDSRYTTFGDMCYK